MRREIIDAKTRYHAHKLAPWAAVIARVDGGGGAIAWMAFESRDDYRIWRGQR